MTAKLVYRQCPGLGGLAGWVCPFPARVTILDRAEQLQYYPQPLVNSVEITNEGFRVKEFCSACQAEKDHIERKIANEPALHSHECQASTCHHAPHVYSTCTGTGCVGTWVYACACEDGADQQAWDYAKVDRIRKLNRR